MRMNWKLNLKNSKNPNRKKQKEAKRLLRAFENCARDPNSYTHPKKDMFWMLVMQLFKYKIPPPNLVFTWLKELHSLGSSAEMEGGRRKDDDVGVKRTLQFVHASGMLPRILMKKDLEILE
ncbi:hypothetical protein SLEP1_g13363 [Rubroshorea leprosula]|uniref:Uncharacterized protein n=1 Tax=Rubroshorea leprosula TaxID=152421 RepID=A0AAV5IFM4_9ROSI|nr:hypothetical protein SLEP1_g13363 [Rubroshorea leprosula]